MTPSIQTEGDLKILTQLAEGIEQVTATTNALKEQLMIIMQQHKQTHLGM